MLRSIKDVYEEYKKVPNFSNEKLAGATGLRSILADLDETELEDITAPPFGWRLKIRNDDRGLFEDCEGEIHVAKVAIWGELPDVKLSECEFFVIITIDCDDQVSLKGLYPPNVYTKWDITENESDDLTVFGGKYRKVVGTFTHDEFETYCGNHTIQYEGETMGSLSGYGWLPALSMGNFGLEQDYYINMYVTPIPLFDAPESERKQTLIWETLKEQLKEM